VERYGKDDFQRSANSPVESHSPAARAWRLNKSVSRK
jgi:hypothetical protein